MKIGYPLQFSPVNHSSLRIKGLGAEQSQNLTKQQALVRSPSLDRSNLSLSGQRISEALDRSTNGFFATGSLLSNIGRIHNNQKDYHDESRLYTRFTAEDSSEEYSPDFSKIDEITTLEKMTLSITTREGDQIDVEIKREQGSFRHSSETFISASFNYEVKGDLDTQEQEALQELSLALGGSSQNFFSNGQLSLKAAKVFDSEQLSQFSVSMDSQQDSAQFSFSVDDSFQDLSVTSNDYSAALRIDLSHLFQGEDLLKTEGYLDQLRLIEKTAKTLEDTEHDPNAVEGFYKDVLALAFSTASKHGKAQASEVTNAIENAEDYLSGLPDFTATFASKFTRPNPDKLYERNGFSLELSQKTEVKIKNGKTHVYQDSSGEMLSMQHKSIAALMAPDFAGQHYKYSISTLTQLKQREVVLNKAEVIDAKMTVEEEEEKSEDTFIDGKLASSLHTGKRSVAYYALGANRSGYELRDFQSEHFYQFHEFDT